MVMKIKKVSSIPVPGQDGKYEAETLYFVRTGGRLEIHLTSSDGASISHVQTQKEVLGAVIAYQDTPPALPNETPFWMDTTNFTLHTQYDDGQTVQWVEAMPSFVPPEFAGTGEANTMARSDHNHDATYAKIGVMEW